MAFAKGELDPGEDHLAAAKREFYEEVGVKLPAGELIDLGVAQSGSKQNRIWAIEADVDLSQFTATLASNVFSMEWPRGSGNVQDFPENDRAEWHTLTKARKLVFDYLHVTLDRLAAELGIEELKPPEQQSLL